MDYDRLLVVKNTLEMYMTNQYESLPVEIEVGGSASYGGAMNGVYRVENQEKENGFPVWRKSDGWHLKFGGISDGLCWTLLHKSHVRARLREPVFSPVKSTRPWELYSVVGWSANRDFSVKEGVAVSDKDSDFEEDAPPQKSPETQSVLNSYYEERERREKLEAALASVRTELENMTSNYKEAMQKTLELQHALKEERETRKAMQEKQKSSMDLMKSIQESLIEDVEVAGTFQKYESDVEREERETIERKQNFRKQGLADNQLQLLIRTFQKKTEKLLNKNKDLQAKHKEKQTELKAAIYETNQLQHVLDDTMGDLDASRRRGEKLREEKGVLQDELDKMRMQVETLVEEKEIAIEQKFALLNACSEEIQRLSKLVPTRTTTSVRTSLTYLLPEWL